jgi:hypothetical protein
MLTRHAPTSKCAKAASSECRSSCSCGSKSQTVVPRSRLPRLRIAPGLGEQAFGQQGLAGPRLPHQPKYSG